MLLSGKRGVATLVALALLLVVLLYVPHTPGSGWSAQTLASVLSFSNPALSLNVLNKALAWTGVLLVSIVFLFGSLSHFFPKRFTPYLQLRKGTGIVGALFLLFHGAYQLYAYYGLDWQVILFQNPLPVAFTAAAIAALIFLAMLATSNQGAMKKMGYPKWKALHRTGYLALFLGAVHVSAMATIEPQVTLAPVAFLLLALAAITVLVRLSWRGPPRKPRTVPTNAPATLPPKQ